jgi:hypothetical protein
MTLNSWLAGWLSDIHVEGLPMTFIVATIIIVFCRQRHLPKKYDTNNLISYYFHRC